MEPVGKLTDLFYPNRETTLISSIQTTLNTKYSQTLASTVSQGTFTFNVPCSAGVGVSDVVISLQLATFADPSLLGLTSGWGYGAIRSASWRVGGSSTYVMSGQQLLLAAMKDCDSKETASDLLTLGGTQGINAALNDATKNTAYVFLKFPWCSLGPDGKKNPLPTDLVTSGQVVLQIELNPPSAYMTNTVTGNVYPTIFKTITATIAQVAMTDSSKSLVRRPDVDMMKTAVHYPIEFLQREIAILMPSIGGGLVSSASVVGFQSGHVKRLDCWLTKGSDTGLLTANPNAIYAPLELQVSYAGEVFASYSSGSGGLWHMLNYGKAPMFSCSKIAGGQDALPSATTFDSKYVSVPFTQPYDDESYHNSIILGKDLSSGILQISFIAPSSAADWTLHVSPVYNGDIVFSQGQVGLLFA